MVNTFLYQYLRGIDYHVFPMSHIKLVICSKITVSISKKHHNFEVAILIHVFHILTDNVNLYAIDCIKIGIVAETFSANISKYMY